MNDNNLNKLEIKRTQQELEEELKLITKIIVITEIIDKFVIIMAFCINISLLIEGILK